MEPTGLRPEGLPAVCAYGAHIVRLREALEARFQPVEAAPAEAEAVLAE